MKQLLIILGFSCLFFRCSPEKSTSGSYLMTVTGPICIEQIGKTLEHEHLVTDFIGAEKVAQPQYQVSQAEKLILPFLQNLKNNDIKTLFECTPEFIGRDVLLLRELSKKSGLYIITNTGYYAAANKRFLPKHAYTETAEQLSERWISEWENGIKGTGIKPGFIKLGVGKESLDSVEQKIVKAGALTHLKTGLKIAIHTGSAIAANDEIDILEHEGISANALIIVHAQNIISDEQKNLIKRGAWISLDGINQKPETIEKYIEFLVAIKNENLLDKVLISHDDGWSVIQKDDGIIDFELFGNGNKKPFSTIFEILFPRLKEFGFTQENFNQLLIQNPGQAYKIEVCRK